MYNIENVIEGIFDGQNMLSDDGDRYNVPANYASKSRLVEGDRLKLTIDDTGKYIYKQILPVERKNLVGVMIYSNGLKVSAGGREYEVLPAALTFYKARVGDRAVIIIPALKESSWAALENIIRNKVEEEEL